MSSKCTIIIDKDGFHEKYVHCIFRALLLGTNSTFKMLIELIKYEWYTVTEIKAVDLIQNATDKYDIIVTSKECIKTYPKGAKIIVLATRLSKLEKVNNAAQKSASTRNHPPDPEHPNGRGKYPNNSYVEVLDNL